VLGFEHVHDLWWVCNQLLHSAPPSFKRRLKYYYIIISSSSIIIIFIALGTWFLKAEKLSKKL